MSERKHYRKRPLVVEAYRWDGTAAGAVGIIDWVLTEGGSASYECRTSQESGACTEAEGDHIIVIRTLEGNMEANPGDYVIRGIAGEFYPHDGDLLPEAYDEVCDD